MVYECLPEEYAQETAPVADERLNIGSLNSYLYYSYKPKTLNPTPKTLNPKP